MRGPPRIEFKGVPLRYLSSFGAGAILGGWSLSACAELRRQPGASAPSTVIVPAPASSAPLVAEQRDDTPSHAVPGARARPCRPTVDWWAKVPDGASNCRAEGRQCKDLPSARLESCSLEILSKLVSWSEYEEILKQDGPALDFERIRSVYVRGYLRRIAGHPRGRLVSGHSAPATGNDDETPDPDATCGTSWTWHLALVREDEKGVCKMLPAGLGCSGDATVACCPFAEIDSDTEVAMQPAWKRFCVLGRDFVQPIPHPRTKDQQH